MTKLEKARKEAKKKSRARALSGAEIYQPSFRKGYAFIVDGVEVFFYSTPLCGAHIRDIAWNKYFDFCENR